MHFQSNQQNNNSNNMQPANNTNNQSFYPQYDPYTSTQSAQPQPPQPPQKPKSKTNPIKIFLRFIAVVLILALISLTGLFVFTITNPNNEISKWIVQNTIVGQYLDLPGTENQSSSSQESSTKLINNIIQGGNDQNADRFEFASPAESKPVVQIVQNVLPSVISLSLSQKGEGLNQEITAGTGYVVTTDGLVVTNKHVVAITCRPSSGSQIQITGKTFNDKALELELLSIDPIDDVALLRIKTQGEPFIPVQLSNSDEILLGQEVITIGNVLGELQNTVTKGIVSGLSRSFETDLKDPCTGGDYQADGLIQTDAAINRGNSGGPLFNASGQLIGMNTLGTTDSENIGLAIPSSTIQNVLQGYTENNQIVRARLGVTSLQVNAVRKVQNPWIPTSYGEIVFAREGGAVDKGSAADLAGLKDGDIILEVQGEKLEPTTNNPSPLRRAILRQQPGDTIKVRVLKSTGVTTEGFAYEPVEQEIEIKLGSISYDITSSQIKVS